MADAKICDRCGHVIPVIDDNGDKPFYDVLITTKRYTNNSDHSHLCVACGQEMLEVFDRFLKTPTKNQVSEFNKSVDDALGELSRTSDNAV